jgi:DNA repair exonuclease SbcCD ATPase subunit
MKIRQVYIEGFGKFEDFSLNLKDGLNIVFGGNAAGKTTLANFIRYCLTGNLAKLEDYRPWYSKKFGGRLETDEGTVHFGSGAVDPEVFLFTSFLPEHVDDTLEGSQKISSLVSESYRNLFPAREMERVMNEDFSSLMEKEKMLRNEISNLEMKINEWKGKRKKVLLLMKKKKNLEEELLKSRRLLDEERGRLEEEKKRQLQSIDFHLEEVKKKLLDVEAELKELESQIVSSKNDLEEAYGLFQKLNYLKERQSQLEMEIKELEKKYNETREKMEDILKDFSCRSFEELKLRLENLRLQMNLVENEHRARMNEISSRLKRPLEEIERQMNTINERLEKIGDRMKKADRTLSVFKVLVSVFLTFSVVSAVFIFLASKNPFIYLTFAGAGGALLSIWNYFRVKEELQNLDSEFVTISSQKRELMEEKNQVLKRLKEAVGVEDIDGLETVLEKQLNSRMFEIAPFLAKYGSDPRKALENVENQIRELLMMKDSLASSLTERRKNLEELTEYMREQEEEFRKALEKVGLESVEELLKQLELKEQLLRLEREKKDLQNTMKKLLEEKENVESMKSSQRIKELEERVNSIGRELEALEIPPLEEPYGLMEQLTKKRLEFALTEKIIENIPAFKDRVKRKYSEFVIGYTEEFSKELSRVYREFFGESMVFNVSPHLAVAVNVPQEKSVMRVLNTSALKVLALHAKDFVSRVLEIDLPLVIDNTFVDLDDGKIDLLWSKLKETARTRQVILFTSDRRFLREEPIFTL